MRIMGITGYERYGQMAMGFRGNNKDDEVKNDEQGTQKPQLRVLDKPEPKKPLSYTEVFDKIIEQCSAQKATGEESLARAEDAKAQGRKMIEGKWGRMKIEQAISEIKRDIANCERDENISTSLKEIKNEKLHKPVVSSFRQGNFVTAHPEWVKDNVTQVNTLDDYLIDKIVSEKAASSVVVSKILKLAPDRLKENIEAVQKINPALIKTMDWATFADCISADYMHRGFFTGGKDTLKEFTRQTDEAMGIKHHPIKLKEPIVFPKQEGDE